MISSRSFPTRRQALLSLVMAGAMAFPAVADEKEGMPDLCQIDQTCFPTSTSNLMIWFGTHGYPNLILSGDTKDERYLHTVHGVMTTTDARFDLGTKMENLTSGIEKFVKSTGYDCNAEYRGMSKKGNGVPFTRDWLKENDDPNKGFILLIGYFRYHPESNSFTEAIGASHAVTLVDAEPDMLLIHDPAHEEDETGRKIVMTQTLTDGTLRDSEESVPATGLLLLNGTLLGTPENSQVVLFGAICVTMHPGKDGTTPTTPKPDGPGGIVAGGAVAGNPSATPAAPGSAGAGWWSWLIGLLFKK